LWLLLFRLLLPVPVCESFPDDTRKRFGCPFGIFNAQRGPLIIAKIEFRNVTMQVLLAAMLLLGPRRRRRVRCSLIFRAPEFYSTTSIWSQAAGNRHDAHAGPRAHDALLGRSGGC
jgi:hypothetical protein